MTGKARVVVVGAGMGGLAAALRLAHHGFRVTVVEARDDAGGLASGMVVNGFHFDAGPYILLDRAGLDWAFGSLGLDLAEHVKLARIPEVYEVSSPTDPPVRIVNSLEETAAGFERDWTGSGKRYRHFIDRTGKIYRRLEPLRWTARPRPGDLVQSGAWRDVPFLLRPLGSCLGSFGLPDPVREAIGIWTHVAGQSATTAPSPLALVPVVIHQEGAHYPEGGIHQIPRALESAGRAAGVDYLYGTRVRSVSLSGRAVTGVVTEGHGRIPADAVVSNVGGLQTYLSLVEDTPRRERERLHGLPRQSPGVCAYLQVKGHVRSPYLRFHLPGEDQACRLLIVPGAVSGSVRHGDWSPARLMAPMAYARAERAGERGQEEFVREVIEESWWRQPFHDVRVLATRTPCQWGADYRLWGNSMNPAMTARMMRAGRLPHRSPRHRGLYLAGSSTHPGQWVSFCAISGIFAADCLREDLA